MPHGAAANDTAVMLTGTAAARLLRALSAATALGLLCACGPAASPGDSLSGAATAACARSGAAPAFVVDGSSTADTLVVSTPSGGPPFKAFVQFALPGAPPLTGGELVPAEAPPAGGGRDYYVAPVPPLRTGATYAVTLQLMQYTNLPPECQKSFTVALGTITGR